MSSWPLDPPISYPSNPLQETQLVFAIGGTQYIGASPVLNDSVYEIHPDDWDGYYGSINQGWTSRTVLPTPRTGLCSATLNNLIYVIGGNDGSNVLGTVEIYDPATNSWTAGAPMPTPRSDMAIALVNRQIYIIGGRDTSGPLGTVEIYDPVTNSWSPGPSMPSPAYGIRVAYDCLRNSPLLSVPGGIGVNGISNEIRVFNPTTNTWSIPVNMYSGRAFYGVMGDNTYVIGGYDQITGQITHAADLPPTASPWLINATGFSSPVANFGYTTYYRRYSVHSGYSGGVKPFPTDSTFAGMNIIVLDNGKPGINLSESGNGFLLEAQLPETQDWHSVALERSREGQLFFELAAVEFPGETWSFLDSSPFSKSTFYRFRGIDQQGAIHYSEVVQGSHEFHPTIKIAPNPAHDLAVLILPEQDGAGPTSIEIYDLSGKQLLLLSQLSSTGVVQLDLSGLPMGNLLVKVSNSSGSFHRLLLHQ